MQKRQVPAGLMGMNQDVRSPQVNTKQAFEIVNMRLNPNKDGYTMELTSERGMKEIDLSEHSQFGTIIGHCVIGNYIVLFSKIEGTTDRIFRLEEQPDSSFARLILYSGNLGFNVGNPIETIASYENQNVQKVYWIDGINQTRVINVAGNDQEVWDRYNLDSGVGTYDPFSFMIKVDQVPSVNVEKLYTGGLFHSGVVQYAVSYYNRNAQETPIVSVTPLYYASLQEYGGKPDEQVGCCFDVDINFYSDRFDFIRVYRIYRTTLDATPMVSIIHDFDIKEADGSSLHFVDTNERGIDFDAYRLLIPQTPIKPNTFTHKDQKLFEGTYTTNDDKAGYDIFKRDPDGPDVVTWDASTKDVNVGTGQQNVTYDYASQLDCGSNEIHIFKQREWYKLGL